MLIETEDYLTITQAAQLLGCSAQNIVTLCNGGRLPCIRNAFGWRLIAKDDVRAYAVNRYGHLLELLEEH